MAASPRLWATSFDMWLYRATFRSPSGMAPCTAQAEGLAAFTGVQAAAIVVVGLFNLLLAAAAVRLARFQRHRTAGGEENAVAFGVFVGQFVNTFLVCRARRVGVGNRGERVLEDRGERVLEDDRRWN
jgi:hypothetical protein